MKFSDLETSTQVILKVIFAVLVLVFLWTIREIIFILLLSLILSSAMASMVNFLMRFKIPRSVSVLTVYILFLGLVGLVSYLLIPVVIEQFKILLANLPNYIASLQGRFGHFFEGTEITQLLLQQLSGFNTGSVVSTSFGIFNSFIAVISVLVISFYLVAQEKSMKEFVSDLIPPQHQDFAISLIDKIQKKMGLWILGQFFVCLIMFATTWIGLSLMHVPYALILALIAGLLEVVPYIGPFLSAIPAIFIALLQSPALALGVVVLYILLHELEGYILVPKVMEKTLGTSSLVTLVALLIGFKLAGIAGILVSVPVASAITVVIHEFLATKSTA